MAAIEDKNNEGSDSDINQVSLQSSTEVIITVPSRTSRVLELRRSYFASV